MEFKCDYFESLNIGETFWIEAELFQKTSSHSAIRIEGMYEYNKDVKKLVKE